MTALQFQYSAVDAKGRQVSALLDASSLAAAQQTLAAQGMKVYALEAVSPAAEHKPAAGVMKSLPTAWTGSETISAQVRGSLLDELATLLEAGVPLADALASLEMAHQGSALGRVLSQVQRQLRAGQALSAVLAGQAAGADEPNGTADVATALGLPQYVLALIQAGEATGRLAASCRAAAAQLASDEAFAREMRTALVYPAVLLVSGFLAVLVVFIFVVPKFAGLLANPKAQLPWISQWVLKAGLWTGANTWSVGFGLLALAAAAVFAWRQPKLRLALWDGAARLPGLGRWVREAELYRWASMMAMMLEHRVHLLQAMMLSQRVLRAEQLSVKALAASEQVRQGKTLTQAIGAQAMLDAPALALVQTGERSAALGRTLASLARRYEQATKARIARALVLLEPLMILLISVLLGGIMISVILAVTSLTNVI